MKKNVASQVIGVQMVSASDGSAFTGTVSVAVTVDGGTQTSGGGTGPTHEGNGFHTYIPTQAETNGDHIAFTFTGTGAIPVTVQVYTTFPQTGDSYSRLGAPAGASISADIAAMDSNVDAILADTGTDGVVVAAASKTGYSLSADQSGVTVGTVNALGAQAKADVNAEADTALSDYDPPTKAELDAGFAGLNDLDAAGIRAAVGLASANLDTQLSTIDNFLDTEIAAILAAVDTEVAAIKAQTDKLTFTVANQVDANIQSINDAALTGNGTSGNEWGPA